MSTKWKFVRPTIGVVSLLITLAFGRAVTRASLMQDSQGIRVKLVDASTERPIEHTVVVIEHVYRVVCRKAPCPPWHKVLWMGRSDATGYVLLPQSVIQQKPYTIVNLIVVDGYNKQPLRLEAGVIKLLPRDAEGLPSRRKRTRSPPQVGRSRFVAK